MTIVLIAVIVILAAALGVLVWARAHDSRGRRAPVQATSSRRILFPFVAGALSQRALDAALRLAKVEGATLVPVFLARVSLDLPLESALPRQCSMAMPLLEAVEQRATEAGIAVDSRIVRGRNRRHALRQAIAEESFDRIVIAASAQGSPGFDPDDVAWLLENAPGEIVVLRPSAEDQSVDSAGLGRSRGGSALRPAWNRRGGHALSRAGETAASR
jgi:Universal stress protein family